MRDGSNRSLVLLNFQSELTGVQVLIISQEKIG
jgi:hypothetical protein